MSKTNTIRDNIRSLRFKFLIAAVLLLLVVMAIIVYIRFYTMDALRDQVAQVNTEMVGLYLKDLDSHLNNTSKALANFIVDNSAFRNYFNAYSIDDMPLILIKIIEEMRKQMISEKLVEAIYMYDPANDLLIYAVASDANSQTINQVNTKIRYIIDNRQIRPLRYNNWSAFFSQEKGFLHRVIERDGIYVGAWVDVDKLASSMNREMTNKNRKIIFVSKEGTALSDISFVKEHGIDLQQSFTDYYLSGKNHKHIVVGQNSSQGDFALLSLTRDDALFAEFPVIAQILITVALPMILYLVLYALFLRRTLLSPMQRLQKAMADVGRGNVDSQLNMSESSTEFRVINRTFDTMLTQIHQLKIDNYEQKIQSQQFELEHLKLQINPHFFMNSLNVLYALAKSKNYDLIMEMSLHLIRYFRYMFANKASLVPLSQELEHIQNYMAIQKRRFPEQIDCIINTQSFLANHPIPPFCIHTFVENSVKYSSPMDTPIRIDINTELLTEAEKNYLKITVKDNGCGYAPRILEKLNQEQPIFDEYGERIGIANVRDRLKIIYNGQAKLLCTNQPEGGALNQIYIPLRGGHG
ncbi:MAG: sensor histidine kinase [Saccharofermentanales bacterium]|nr:histidine kinase [Clostridiaceae bacterium]